MREESIITIHWGNIDCERCDDFINTTFQFIFKPEWITNDWGRKVIKDLDESNVIHGRCITSPYLGDISPWEISGGAKVLITAYNKPGIYPLELMGDNCADLLYELGKLKDTHWYYAGYLLEIADAQKVRFVETGDITVGFDATYDYISLHRPNAEDMREKYTRRSPITYDDKSFRY